MKRTTKNDNQKGAVLITTLLLMSVMAVLTISIMDDIRFSIKRTASMQTAEQLSWYSRGGEDYAQSWLGSQLDERQQALRKFILLNLPAIFPIEDGELQIRMEDGRNCFNVNELAAKKNGVDAHRKLALLFNYLEFDGVAAETLASQIQDWVDADSVPGQGGAEDYIYTSLTPAYRAANTAMADITELREIQSVDEGVFQRIRPFLCVLPNTDANKINLNTLKAWQAPLLGAEFGPKGGLRLAEEVIADRPLAGYDSVATVKAKDDVKKIAPNGFATEFMDIKTDRVKLQIDIKLGDQRRSSLVQFDISKPSQVKLISRRSRF